LYFSYKLLLSLSLSLSLSLWSTHAAGGPLLSPRVEQVDDSRAKAGKFGLLRMRLCDRGRQRSADGVQFVVAVNKRECQVLDEISREAGLDLWKRLDDEGEHRARRRPGRGLGRPAKVVSR